MLNAIPTKITVLENQAVEDYQKQILRQSLTISLKNLLNAKIYKKMELWEYKILEFSTELCNLGKTDMGTDKEVGVIEIVRFREIERVEENGFLGKKIKRIATVLTNEKIEKIFNELGKQGWNLCETTPLVTNTVHAWRYGTRTTSVQYIFKRQISR